MNRLRTTPIVAAALALAAIVLLAAAPAADTAPLVEFGSTPILSTFTGSDESPLFEGGNWAKLNPQSSGDLQRVSGQVADTGANGGSRYWTPADFGPDVEAYVTVATPPSDTIDPVGVGARIRGEGGNNTWDGYLVTWERGFPDTWTIQKVTNGGGAVIASGAVSISSGDKLGIRCLGSTIEAWRFTGGAWSLLGSVSDPTYPDAGRIAITAKDSPARLDDFGGGTLGTFVPPPPDDAPPSPILSSFTGPDESPLSEGGNWANLNTAASGDLQRISNQAADTGANGGARYWTPAQFGPDVEAYVTIATRPSDTIDPVGIAVRVQDAGGSNTWDGYLLTWERGFPDAWFLRKVTNGSSTSLASGAFSLLSGEILDLRAIGSTIEARVYTGAEFVVLGSVQDTTYAGAGRVAITSKDSPARLDDFGARTLGTPPPAGPPIEQTYGTGESGNGVHGHCACRIIAEPVNTRSGAFTTTVDDVATPGTGVAFDWSRSYTSADSTVGRLGPGWTDSYSASLALQPNGDVLLHGEDGQRLSYAKQANGSFVGAPGSLSTLTSVAGGFELRRTDQVVYAFNTAGRLLSIKDRNNQGVTLAYDAQNRLQTITDAAGKQVAVSYNASNLVSQVSTQDGRSVAFGYTSGRLASATDVWSGPALVDTSD